MKPDSRFKNQDKIFWANVRSISETLGYTEKSRRRGEGKIRIYTLEDMARAMVKLNLDTQHLVTPKYDMSSLGSLLKAYFEYRAEVLNSYVEPRLMDAERAAGVFSELQARLNPVRPVPMNKQTGNKKAPAYLTGIVNMLIEANAQNLPCDYNPRTLTTVTRDNIPLRTLSRRVDGCFPSCVNPIAVWEIKEYYYTTTFGSRVADGVYETLLDGFELEELRKHESVDIQHLLAIDSHFTWWVCGRSYLCRLIDMLHMGYVDEILFGYEVIERLPAIVHEWAHLAKGSP